MIIFRAALLASVLFAAQSEAELVLHQPGVTAPIVGITKVAQLDELVGVLNVKLDAAELKALSDVYQSHEVIADMPRPK